MIRTLLDLFHGKPAKPEAAQRPKVMLDARPDHIYAIGDVHGCDDLLAKLEALIVADSQMREGTKCIVMLGDYVDRGPKSASVLDRLIARTPAGMTRYCLAGNHEEVMLDFLRNPASDHRWLNFGGMETLSSYGIHDLPSGRQALKNKVQAHVPDEHIQFLDSLPALISVPGFCFVHAGLEDGVPLAEQRDEALLWLRPTDGDNLTEATDRVTVHGHTPVRVVEIGSRRINVDTGAYMSAKLSAVRISSGNDIGVMATG